MEYHGAVNRLEGLGRLSPDLGTETTAGLLAALDDPHESVTAVQITGSNGKGSTARTLERVLRETGLSVGLYTSPDLNDLRERVRVDGRKIPKRAVTRFVEEIWPEVIERSADGVAPTFFEVLTALALWHFERRNVDVAVLEVGIGGRYDATSVVDPVAAAVTNVSLEHTDVLGTTVEEIARDKAQVAPDGAPLVTGARGPALEAIRAETDVLTVAGRGEERAADVEAAETGMVSRTASSVALAGDGWEVSTTSPLLGQHQATNAGIAAALAKQVAGASDDDIAAGVRKVDWPGRFEIVGHDPLAVLDGAHNPDACAKLATLLERFEYDDLHLVFGAMRDKSHAEMVRALPEPVRVALATPAVDRAQDTDTLAAVFERATDARVDHFDSVLAAVDRTLRAAGEGDCVLVAGSLYAVAEARDRWTRTPSRLGPETPSEARSTLRRADVPQAVRAERAADVSHRTIGLHARRSVAADLTATMRSLGGTGAYAGIDDATQHVDVVLSGTFGQFRSLVEHLRAGGERRHLAAQLAASLETEVRQRDPTHPWSDGTAVMGILNVTPDSFHDGGEYDALEAAVDRAEDLVAAGADVVDVGGESTRPGADPVDAAAERERVVPVVERIADLDAAVSVDTRKPSVARAALEAGADMINDVSGLEDVEMRRVVADWDVPVVVMHSLATPVETGPSYEYDDVVTAVLAELTERVLRAERAGIDRSQIVVDPGLGFGKRPAESFELLDRIDELRALGTSIMVGHSHKSMFEDVDADLEDRFASTLGATALAVDRGVDIVRVHDVAPNVAAVATAEATDRGNNS
jgi:dihydropteroate synthase